MAIKAQACFSRKTCLRWGHIGRLRVRDHNYPTPPPTGGEEDYMTGGVDACLRCLAKVLAN